MRDVLFVIAALATLAGAVVVLLSTKMVGLVPIKWRGAAVAGKALFGDGDASDEDA